MVEILILAASLAVGIAWCRWELRQSRRSNLEQLLTSCRCCGRPLHWEDTIARGTCPSCAGDTQ